MNLLEKKVGEHSSSKNKSQARELEDFEKHAIVVEPAPVLPEHLTMDSTSHLEISKMLNQKYSDEIVRDAIKVFNLEKLNTLKEKRLDLYLAEGKRQVNELWRCIEALEVHTAMFTVSFLIAIGKILNDIERALGKKSKYMKWLKENFGYKHLRYFQHAKQLDKMGDFARVHASLGKNRLLEFDRLKRELDQSFPAILSSQPFEDTTADFDGVLFKEHVDSIITYHRFLNAGVDFISFEQAALIAAFLHRPIKVKDAKYVKEWLDKQAEADDKEKAFDFYVFNKGSFPDADPNAPRRSISLTQYIADLVAFSEKADIDDAQWIQEHKDKISDDELVKVYQFISKLAEKLDINLNNQDPAEGAGGERGVS
jgi:hypothetical protein